MQNRAGEEIGFTFPEAVEMAQQYLSWNGAQLKAFLTKYLVVNLAESRIMAIPPISLDSTRLD